MFTQEGNTARFKRKYAEKHGVPYPGHVPPRPMPAPAPQAPIPILAYPPAPPQRPHHRMFIVAAEDIRAGQVIYLDAVSDGSYNAHLRKIG